MSIDSFTGEYRFLSNFYSLDKITVEHKYQAAKCLYPEDAKKIIEECNTPGQAKRMGKSVTLRPDWNTIRLDVMYRLVKEKFDDNYLKRKLLETGDSELIEGNTWGDIFWGVCNGIGQNHLGKILMRVRDELRG